VQGVSPSETLDTLFKWNQERFTSEEISPGVTKGSYRETLRQRMSGKSSDQAMFVHQLRRDG